MPDDPLPGSNTPPAREPPPPPVSRRAERCTCEFCECEMARDGSYFQLSDRAKKLRDQGSVIERLEADKTKLESELTATKQALAEARNPARRGDWESALP